MVLSHTPMMWFVNWIAAGNRHFVTALQNVEHALETKFGLLQIFLFVTNYFFYLEISVGLHVNMG